MIARADIHTVTALRREQAPCAVCEGTGRHWERDDHTGMPAPCCCPQCGGTGMRDEPARAAVPMTGGRELTMAEHDALTEAANECPF